MNASQTEKRIPWKPETMEVLRARTGKALEPIYGPGGIRAYPPDARPHLFDFDDGLRFLLFRWRGSQ
jgi:hypothetical protein